MTDVIKVSLFGKTVGFLTWDSGKGRALFEYDRAFAEGDIDIAVAALSGVVIDVAIEGDGTALSETAYLRMTVH